ncbi:hypothetical protein CCMA1212_002848 [Trichoderma ghanense]|uniref:Uncharacterized protein n=1 Tax=Trichoderma ghanense TaxID=65468 RepID=A0ABY2HA07_9HYPO
MDSPSLWQHNPLQRQEKALEEDQAWHLSNLTQKTNPASSNSPPYLAPTVPTSSGFHLLAWS